MSPQNAENPVSEGIPNPRLDNFCFSVVHAHLTFSYAGYTDLELDRQQKFINERRFQAGFA